MPSQSRDRGLTHLGLVLEALGWMKAAGAGFIVLSLLLHATEGQNAFGDYSQVLEMRETMFLAGLVSLLAAILLALAGRGLTQSSARAAKVYVIAGGIAEIVYVFVLFGQSGGVALLVSIAGALSLPLVVAIALQYLPKSTNLPADSSLVVNSLVSTRFAKPEDGGLAGLFSIMMVAASVEVVGAAFVAWATWSMESFMRTPGMIMAMLLVARALMQCVCALDMRDPHKAESGRKYTVLGLASGPIYLVSMVVFADSELLTLGLTGALVLMVWPYLVRRFLRQRNAFVEQHSASLAPDRGLGALGWLLIVVGLPEVFLCAGALLLGGVGNVDTEFFLACTLSLLQVWAGVEMVRLGSNIRLAAGLLAATGVVVAAFAWREVLASGSALDSAVGPLIGAVTLCLPLMSLLLVLHAGRPLK